MKTQLFKILHISITMLFLAACSDSRQPEILDDTPDVPIDIVVSRSTTEQNGNNALATKFTPGCEIGISVKGSSEYRNRQYKYPTTGAKLEPTNGTIYCGAQSTIEAYYPYRNDGNYTRAYVNADQTYESNYYGSDALSATGTLNGNKVLNLNFKHRMAKVVFTFNHDVEKVRILNQSISTAAPIGNTEIIPYKESPKKWSAFIVPGQSKLEINLEVNMTSSGKSIFKSTLNLSTPLVAGRQYTFKIDKLRRKDKENKVWINLDEENKKIDIEDDDIYWITTKSSNGPTANRIIIKGGSPTVHLVGLNMESNMPIEIRGGNPTFIIEGENKITSNEQGRTAIGGQAGASIVIRGVNSSSRLIATSGWGGAAIGSGQGGGCGDITIENCYVKAESTRIKANAAVATGGAGIGSALVSGCGNINIKNSTIEAIGTGAGAAIGSGRGGQCGNITIENSTITASTGDYHGDKPAIIGAGCGDIYFDSNQPDGICGNIRIKLKSGETKDAFLNGLTPADWADKVGAGNFKSKCGTVTWL